MESNKTFETLEKVFRWRIKHRGKKQTGEALCHIIKLKTKIKKYLSLIKYILRVLFAICALIFRNISQ